MIVVTASIVEELVSGLVGVAAGGGVTYWLDERRIRKDDTRAGRLRDQEEARAAAKEVARALREIRAEMGPLRDTRYEEDWRLTEWGDAERRRAAELAAVLKPRIGVLDDARKSLRGAEYVLAMPLLETMRLFEMSSKVLGTGTPSPASTLVDEAVEDLDHAVSAYLADLPWLPDTQVRTSWREVTRDTLLSPDLDRSGAAILTRVRARRLELAEQTAKDLGAGTD